MVSPGFFKAMGIRLIDGRFSDERDSLETPDVCVVNQTMARAFWGNKSAIGRRIHPGNNDPWCTIVGVIADVKNAGLERPAGTEVYLPFNQRQAVNWRWSTRFIVARTHGDLDALARSIRKEV